MKIKLSLALLILASTALFSGCIKEGPVGPQGAPGLNGTNGSNGNANVSAATIGVSSWSNDSLGWYAAYNVSAITSAAQSSGAIQVFFSVDLGTTWIVLPWAKAGSDYSMSFLTQTDYLEVDWDYVGPGIGSNPNAYFSQTVYLKVVVIPPAIRKNDVDYSSYAAIKKAYNLKDSFSSSSIVVSKGRLGKGSSAFQ